MLWPAPRSTAAPKYTLTLTADPACDTLPPDIRSRSYSAVLQADDGSNRPFTMPLGDADFYPTQRIIWGSSEAELKIYVSSWEAAERWLEDDPIVESLGGSRYLAVMGTVVTKVQAPAQSLTATLEGTFSYCSKGAPNTTFFECAARTRGMPLVEPSTEGHAALAGCQTFLSRLRVRYQLAWATSCFGARPSDWSDCA